MYMYHVTTTKSSHHSVSSHCGLWVCTTSPRLKVHIIPYQVTVTFGSCTTSPRLKVHTIPYRATVAFGSCTTSTTTKSSHHSVSSHCGLWVMYHVTTTKGKVHTIPYQFHLGLEVMYHVITTKRSTPFIIKSSWPLGHVPRHHD